MPELPEVETTRRGLAPHLAGRTVTGVEQRRAGLRWPFAPELRDLLPGQRIDAVRRRAKYLLVDTAAGSALLHLGMSGSLRVLPRSATAGPHDHADLLLAGEVKRILAHAIERGGTTLRDFIAPDGAPGYFELELLAYGRGGEPCLHCGRPLREAAIAQRTTAWCPACQR